MAILAIVFDKDVGRFLAQNIGADQLQNQAIVSAKLGAGAVGTPHLAAQAVTSAHVGANVLATPHMQNQGILSASFGAQAVGFPHLVRGATSGEAIVAQGSAANPIYASVAGATTFAALTDIKRVRKTADETVNNSATLQNDNELLFAVGANEVWEFKLFCYSTSTDVADLRIAFSLPAGAAGVYNWVTNYGGLVGGTRNMTTAIQIQSYTEGATGYGVTTLIGIVVIGGTAGNVQFQWAQWTAEVSATQVLTNSFIIAHRLA